VTIILVSLYLAAIVAANLSLAYFGPVSAPINAFLFIGLDLTTRDALHDRWQGRRLPAYMTALVVAGSLLSWMLNRDAGRIALASALSFGIAFTADALVYQRARRRPWLQRVNASNLTAAALDSLVFPLIAFGGLNWRLTGALFVAKVAGGFLWSLLLARFRPIPVHAPATD
jgi:hypothetical protein